MGFTAYIGEHGIKEAKPHQHIVGGHQDQDKAVELAKAALAEEKEKNPKAVAFVVNDSDSDRAKVWDSEKA